MSATSKVITPDKRVLLANGRPVTEEGQIKVPYLTAEDLPFTPLLWYLVIEPRPVPERIGKGVIVAADESKDVERTQTTLGRVVYRGPLVGEGRTTSGLRLNDDPAFAAIKAGDDVMWSKYTSQRVKFEDVKNKVTREIAILSDTDLLCAVKKGAGHLVRYWL